LTLKEIIILLEYNLCKNIDTIRATGGGSVKYKKLLEVIKLYKNLFLE